MLMAMPKTLFSIYEKKSMPQELLYACKCIEKINITFTAMIKRYMYLVCVMCSERIHVWAACHIQIQISQTDRHTFPWRIS